MLNIKILPWITAGLLLLAPWLVFVTQLSVNGDTAWLLIAAERWLGGGDMLHDFFENNPPLSVIIHAPPVLLSWVTGLPVYISAYAFFFGLIGLGLYGLHALLHKIDFIGSSERLAIMAGYTAAITIMPTISFGEREHLILIGLLPFALAQLALTWGIKIPRQIAWPVFVLGGIGILLKPHYGIIPAVLLAHRFIRTKSLKKTLGPDLFILGGMTLAYIGGTWIFFPDYAHEILPDALALYITAKHPHHALLPLAQHLILFFMFLTIETVFSAYKGKKFALMAWLYVLALLCLIPYAVQMKGYYYHLIPAMGFFLTALSYTIQGHLCLYLKKESLQKIVAFAAIFLIAYGNTPPLWNYPTHKDYMKLPLAQQLEKYCPESCTYFIFHDTLEMISQTTLYTGATHASRFSCLWFLPALYHGVGVDAEKQKLLIEKYARYMAEDFERYKPDVLFILSNYEFEPGKEFDLFEFFAPYPDFRKAVSAYRKADSFTMNQRDYMADTALDKDRMLAYDVYVRK